MSEQRVFVIGLDAVETPLLLSLVADGKMPSLEALIEASATTPVKADSLSSLPGAVWQDILTGIDGLTHGNYYPNRLHTGEDTVRDIDQFAHIGDYYFDIAAAAGLDVIVVDQPLIPVYEPASSLMMVSEWHVHDAMYGRKSHPSELMDELHDRFGTPPYDRCDTNHAPDNESMAAFAESLISGMKTKTDMVVHLMDNRKWDLFSVSMSEGHCAGHQFWHLHDKVSASGHSVSGDNQQPDAAHQETLNQRDLLVEVYLALDDAIGRMVEAAGDAAIVLFTSHGMQTYVGGPQLLPELLRRWEYGDPRKLPAAIRRFIPLSAIQSIFRRVPKIQQAAANAGVFNNTLGSTSMAMPVPNNRVGAIRFNVIGREPNGMVGLQDLPAELDAIVERLNLVRDSKTDEPVVDHVIRPHYLTDVDCHPDLPDLLVVFRRDIGEITTVNVPGSDQLHVPIQQPDYPRTGDHTDESQIWIRPAEQGKSLPDDPGSDALQPMRSIDIAPTLLSLLGVAVPEKMQGQNGYCFTENRASS